MQFVPTVGRYSSFRKAIRFEVAKLNLVPLKRVVIKFDPFLDNTSRSAREFSIFLTTDKVQLTNIDCRIKMEVMSDRSPPQVLTQFTDGQNVTYETANLTTLELFTEFNRLNQWKNDKLEPAES